MQGTASPGARWPKQHPYLGLERPHKPLFTNLMAAAAPKDEGYSGQQDFNRPRIQPFHFQKPKRNITPLSADALQTQHDNKNDVSRVTYLSLM